MKNYKYWRFVNKMPARIRIKLIENQISRDEGGETTSEFIREYMSCFFNIQVGYGSYGCFKKSGFKSGDIIGRYCSIAREVQHFTANHPINHITTSPILYQSIYNTNEGSYVLQNNPLTVGNDVWIGYRTIICPNVSSIGNGAIIGAGSVVTKNVEPYTIVAGNPAKVIRKRFSDDQIQLLEKSKWWELDVKQLQSLQDYADDIVTFCEKVNEIRSR